MKKFILISILLSAIGTINLYGQNIELEWAKQIVGQSPNAQTLDNIYPVSINTDQNNNIIIVGTFEGTVDFNPAPSINYDLTVSTQGTGEDCFILKLDNNGNFIWAKSLPFIYASTVKTDFSGNIYLTGHFYAPVDFDPSPTAEFLMTPTWNVSPPYGYFDDLFVLKLDNNGNFIWAKQKEDSMVYGTSISISNIGNVYVSGVDEYAQNAFIQKYDANGTMIWTENLDVNFYVNDISSDSNDDIFCVGRITNGDNYAKLYKLNSSGDLIFQTYSLAIDVSIGPFLNHPPYIDGAPILDLDSNGDVIIGVNSVLPGIEDKNAVLIYKIDNEPDFFLEPVFQWTKTLAVENHSDYNIIGPAVINLQNLKTNLNNDVILSGLFGNQDMTQIDFNPDPNQNNTTTTQSPWEGYILKLNTSGIFEWVHNSIYINGSSNSQSIFMDINNSDNILISGSFDGSFDFDPSPDSEFIMENIGYSDGFILKLNENSITTNISELNKQNIISISPNPSFGKINVNVQSEQIESINISNSLGQVILELNDVNTSNLKIDLKEKPGVYFVNVISNGISKTERFVLQ